MSSVVSWRDTAPMLHLVVAGLLHLSLVSTSHAQDDDDERARVHFESGRVHFDEGEYEAAREAFAAAYALSQRDALHYNLYLCEERLGHFAAAAEHLEQYLASSAPPEADRSTLERRLAHLRSRASAEETPAVAATVEAPQPVIAEPARTDERELVLATAVGLGGAGVLSLVATAVLGGLALGEDARLAASCGADRGALCSDAEVATLGDLTLGADVALAIGSTLAAAGVVLLVVHATMEAPTELTVSLAPSAGGGHAVLRGAW